MKKFYIVSIIDILFEILLVFGAIEEGSLYKALFVSGPVLPILFIVGGFFICKWFIKMKKHRLQLYFLF